MLNRRAEGTVTSDVFSAQAPPLANRIAGFQSRDYDDARRRGDFRWRAGSKHGEYIYAGNRCGESVLYEFRKVSRS